VKITSQKQAENQSMTLDWFQGTLTPSSQYFEPRGKDIVYVRLEILGATSNGPEIGVTTPLCGHLLSKRNVRWLSQMMVCFG
jgi:hypothetical protein